MLHSMVWYGMQVGGQHWRRSIFQQCGMVWYGMVWYGMVWYGMVWYGYGIVWYGMVWYGMVWYGMAQAALAQAGSFVLTLQFMLGNLTDV